jgi:hypothetical protein
MVLYVAMYDTKKAALAAVAEALPSGWKAEEVVGEADQMVVHRKGLKFGDVVQLAS